MTGDAIAAHAVAQALLQRRQLLVNSGLGLEPGEFLANRRLAPEIVDLGLALELVERALDLLEAGEGVGDALVIELAANLDAAGRRFVAGDDRPLARLGVGELRLQLSDVLVLLRDPIVELRQLPLERRQRLVAARLGEQRTLGEVLAPLGDGEFRAARALTSLKHADE